MPEKQPQNRSKPSKLEQVLVGSWNAVKPEGQGKHILEWYDKIKFPPKTREEQKVADKVHVFLKDHPTIIGWGAIATEAALLAGVVAGFRKLKNGKTKRALHSAAYETPVGQKAAVDDHPTDSMAGMTERRERYQWVKHTVLPDSAVDGLMQQADAITAFEAFLKQGHGLLDEVVVSALTRAHFGFLGEPSDSESVKGMLAFLGEFVSWKPLEGSTSADALAALTREIPNRFKNIPPRDYSPQRAIQEAEKVFDRFYRSERWWQRDRPDKRKTFSLWADLGFAAVDFLLGYVGVRGRSVPYEADRMQQLVDGWKQVGWSLRDDA